ncbi:MAG: sulfatase-like hydrolase/transferase [Clostridia bacterium]|jgi:arylsulfatase A-like enzyme
MSKPNVIVFFTDQQRWDTSGLYGNPMDLTPNFDRMAIEGTHCYNGFTCQPVCLPARACLQTGLYASQMNIFNNGGELPQDAVTLGHLYKQAGYTTAYIGKWHMCHEEPVPKEKRSGYDYWLASNILEFTSDAYEVYMYDDEGNKVFLPGYRVDALTDAAIRYITENKDKPFFLFLSFVEPHFQNARDDYPAPTGYEEKYQDPWTPPDLRALGGSSARHLPGYYGMVKRLDEALGRLQDALLSLNLKDQTILAYTADHSCHFKTRNSEYKRSCHDSSLHIPMAFTGPGFTGGGRIKEPVSLIDVPPTLLDACGIDIPASMEGRSIMSLVNKTNVDWQEDIYAEACDGRLRYRCVRTKRWKYIVKAEVDAPKTERPTEYIEWELYDLKADPWELNNLVGYKSHAKVSEIMRNRLYKRLQQVGEDFVTIVPAPEVPSGQKTLKESEWYE